MAEGCNKQLVAADFLGEQLRVLGGALVLQFVSAARAAGGPAWQQEVPLQAVVLFGALEQLQGLALAAVTQQDVQQGLQDAQKAAAAAAEQQREREAVPRSKRGSIAISIEDSSSEEGDDEEQQQQQQQHQHQDDPSSSSEEQQQQHAQAPASGQLLMMQKLLDIIHLTRQFAELNAALNSSTCNSASSSSSNMPKADIMSVADMHAAGGPVHALYSEPCTLNAWAQPGTCCAAAAAAGSSSGAASSSSSSAAAAAAAAATGAADDLAAAVPSAAAAASNGSERQQAPPAAKGTGALQQLYRATLKGALILFAAHRCAFQSVLDSAFGQLVLHDAFLQQCSDEYLRQAIGNSAMQYIAEQAYSGACRRGIRSIEAPEQLLPAMCFGQEQLLQLRWRVGQQLQQLGVDGNWLTLHAVAASVGAGTSRSDSDTDSAGSDSQGGRSNGGSSRVQHARGSSSSRGGWLGGWQQQQQHAEEEDDPCDLAAAVRAGGHGLR
jgi:hypothetical protein